MAENNSYQFRLFDKTHVCVFLFWILLYFNNEIITHWLVYVFFSTAVSLSHLHIRVSIMKCNQLVGAANSLAIFNNAPHLNICANNSQSINSSGHFCVQ